MDTAILATPGPRIMAASAPPTACPDVPPGNGTLNIMMMNENAAMSAMSGTLRALMRLRRRLAPITQKGVTRMNKMSEVSGLR